MSVQVWGCHGHGEPRATEARSDTRTSNCARQGALGFGVAVFGFRVEGSGFRVEGVRFKAWG